MSADTLLPSGQKALPVDQCVSIAKRYWAWTELPDRVGGDVEAINQIRDLVVMLRNLGAQLTVLQGQVKSASFQARVQPWMLTCFGAGVAADIRERGDRLLEEVLELLQAHGYDQDRVATLRDYVYSRPVGEPSQEMGGVMVTLAAFALAAELDMHACGDTELARIWTKMDQIRQKQACKRDLHSPLPGDVTAVGV